jgi:hypothetical protein
MKYEWLWADWLPASDCPPCVFLTLMEGMCSQVNHFNQKMETGTQEDPHLPGDYKYVII